MIFSAIIRNVQDAIFRTGILAGNDKTASPDPSYGGIVTEISDTLQAACYALVFTSLRTPAEHNTCSAKVERDYGI